MRATARGAAGAAALLLLAGPWACSTPKVEVVPMYTPCSQAPAPPLPTSPVASASHASPDASAGFVWHLPQCWDARSPMPLVTSPPGNKFRVVRGSAEVQPGPEGSLQLQLQGFCSRKPDAGAEIELVCPLDSEGKCDVTSLLAVAPRCQPCF